MRKPSPGEANLAALIAAVVGSIGGLFALGLVPAIISRNPQFLAVAPKLNVISFFICGAVGWLVGGQLGPRMQEVLGERNGYIAGGIIGGMIPVLSVAAIGWDLATQPVPR